MSIATYPTYPLQQRQRQAGSHYQEMEINTADPLNLVLILYRGAIKNLKRSLECFSSGCIEGRIDAINRAGAMIGELHSTLDFKRGAQVAASLDRLYAYIQRRLLEANLHKDASAVQEVIKLLTMLESAWEEVRARSDQQVFDGERVQLSA